MSQTKKERFLTLIVLSLGFWLVHCHIDVHADIGQMLVLQVGELKDMPRVPRNVPKCGDYLPSIWWPSVDSDDWSHGHDSDSHDHDSNSHEFEEDNSNWNIRNNTKEVLQNRPENSKHNNSVNSGRKSTFTKRFNNKGNNLKKIK